MTKPTNPFRYFDSSPEVIRLVVMIRFRRMKTLQQFAAVRGTVHNHFNQERHLNSRDFYRERRSAAPAEWRAVMG
jgi:hypothetical protein